MTSISRDDVEWGTRVVETVLVDRACSSRKSVREAVSESRREQLTVVLRREAFVSVDMTMDNEVDAVRGAG